MACHSCRVGRTGNDSLIWAHHSRRTVLSSSEGYPFTSCSCPIASYSGPAAHLVRLPYMAGGDAKQKREQTGRGGGLAAPKQQGFAYGIQSQLRVSRAAEGKQQGFASRNSVHQGQQKASNKTLHVASRRLSLCIGSRQAHGQPYLASLGPKPHLRPLPPLPSTAGVKGPEPQSVCWALGVLSAATVLLID